MAKFKPGEKVLIPVTIREVVETASGPMYRIEEDYWEGVEEKSIIKDPQAEILAANQNFIRELTDRW